MPRYFTRREAEALLPVISDILVQMQAQKQELDRAEEQLRELARKALGNGHGYEEQARRVQAEVERLTNALNAGLHQLNDLGVELKGLEMGLVDFRAIKHGHEYYLCWRLGEPRIAYWHELDAGYAGRQPLPPEE